MLATCFFTVLALPLAGLAYWGWSQLDPVHSSGGGATGLAAAFYAMGRMLTCYAGAAAINLAGSIVGVVGAIVDPDPRGRACFGVGLALNAVPHLLLLGIPLVAAIGGA